MAWGTFEDTWDCAFVDEASFGDSQDEDPGVAFPFGEYNIVGDAYRTAWAVVVAAAAAYQDVVVEEPGPTVDWIVAIVVAWNRHLLLPRWLPHLHHPS